MPALWTSGAAMSSLQEQSGDRPGECRIRAVRTDCLKLAKGGRNRFAGIIVRQFLTLAVAFLVVVKGRGVAAEEPRRSFFALTTWRTSCDTNSSGGSLNHLDRKRSPRTRLRPSFALSVKLPRIYSASARWVLLQNSRNSGTGSLKRGFSFKMRNI
jgi:hypothetical protein